MEQNLKEVNEQVPVEQEPTQQVNTEDLVARASEFKETPQQEETPVEDKVSEFNYSDIGNIETPDEAKQFAEKAYKSFQGDYTRKTQELAEIRKELQKMNVDKEWTPERIQSLLNDPKFVEAAKQVAGPNEEEDSSMMSDEEKRRVKLLEDEVNRLKVQSFQEIQKQQDAQLQNRYKNYNPQAVDILSAELLEGKVNATREHLWKVLDYEDAVKRGYELGKQDAKLGINEQVNAVSFDSGNKVISATEGITKKDGESSRSVWQRIMDKNYNKEKGVQIK